MKKAIKATAIIAALSLILSAFAACSTKQDDTETTTTTESTSQSTTEETTEESTAESTTEETTTEAPETMESVLDLIKKFPVGTAGSSSKCVYIALKLINFTESAEITDETETDIERFSGRLSDREKAMFREGFTEIDYVARKLIEGKSDKYETFLAEAQSAEKYNKGNYSLEKYEAVFEMISKI